MKGEILGTLLALSGVRQWILARRLGVSQSVISQWVRGECLIPSKRIPQLITALQKGKNEGKD